VKIKFEDDGRGVPFVAAVKEVSGVGEALGNAPPKDKASLITADKRWNDGLKPAGKDLRKGLNNAILKGYGAEFSSSTGRVILRE
jgi:hypothetical protein